jgi:hypothetical protein
MDKIILIVYKNFRTHPKKIKSSPTVLMDSPLQKVSSDTENTGKSSRDASLGSSTGVGERSVSGGSVAANNSSAVGVLVTTSAGSNNRAQSA